MPLFRVDQPQHQPRKEQHSNHQIKEPRTPPKTQSLWTMSVPIIPTFMKSMVALSDLTREELSMVISCGMENSSIVRTHNSLVSSGKIASIIMGNTEKLRQKGWF